MRKNKTAIITVAIKMLKSEILKCSVPSVLSSFLFLIRSKIINGIIIAMTA